MKRVFIAVKTDFSLETINKFESIKELLQKSRIKWVDFNNLHITLKFLGNCSEKQIPLIIKELSRISEKFSAFTLEFEGFGIFGNINFPKVFWVGIKENKCLIELQKEIELNMQPLGFHRDTKPFRPHLTLGRVKFLKEKKELVNIITKRAKENLGKITVGKFYFIESVLTKHGPVYTDLSSFILK